MKKTKGFTLVEIIVSVVFLGLIATALVPTFSFSFKQLKNSEAFTQDTFAYQQKIENQIEQKRGQDPQGQPNTKEVTIFGKKVTGHLITVNDSTSSEVTVFVTKNSIPNIVPVIDSAVEIKAYRSASIITPTTPIDFIDQTIHLEAKDPTISDETEDAFLMFVYRWYLSSEMSASDSPSDNTKAYIAVKEWNEAKKEQAYSDTYQLSFIPNIKDKYNQFITGEVKTGLGLTNEEWINSFGNRYIMYGVTPYSNSGRIGKEVLSNKVYLNAPRINILSAQVTSDPKIFRINFETPVTESFDLEKFNLNASLGEIESIQRDPVDTSAILVTLKQAISSNESISENYIQKDGVASAIFGKISIWGQGHPDGRFTILPFANVPLSSLSVTPKTLTMSIGEIKTITANPIPLNTTDTILWEVEPGKESIVSVDDGVVTALKVGVAKVYARNPEGTKSDYCTVTVTQDLISKIGFVQDAKATGTNVNKLYVEFSGDVTHINLTPQNTQQYIKLRIGNTEYHALEYEFVNDKSNAIILYFNNISNIKNATLCIKGNKLMVEKENVEVEDYAINDKIFGEVWYRIYAKHTERSNEEPKVVKYLRSFDGTTDVGQFQWITDDLDNYLWAINFHNDYSDPIQSYAFKSGRYNLTNKNKSQMLEVTGDSSIEFTFNSNVNRQKFVFVTDNSIKPYYMVVTAPVNSNPSYVFDISGNSTANWNQMSADGKLIRWEEKKNQNDNQLFKIEPWIILKP